MTVKQSLHSSLKHPQTSTLSETGFLGLVLSTTTISILEIYFLGMSTWSSGDIGLKDNEHIKQYCYLSLS